MPTLLSDIAGNNTYVWELVILVLILIAIFAASFLSDEPDDLEASGGDAESEDEPDEVPVVETEEAPEKDVDLVHASGLSKLSNTRSDKDLGLVFESTPDVVDDLTKISGVGKVLQEKLNDFGIYRFEQIAAWDEAVIAEFSKRLSFKGRVERENWVSQAEKLAEEVRGS